MPEGDPQVLDTVRRTLRAQQVRKTLRDKVARAIDEVVREYHRENNGRLDRLQQEINGLREELQQRTDQLTEITAAFEHRARRDLLFAGERGAAADSARFAREFMPKVPHFTDSHATLQHALSLVETEGMVLEFGVYTGTTLKMIATAMDDRDVYGFDSFAGLPENWRTGFPAGAFGLDDIPQVPGAELVTGWFEETLPSFMAEHDEPVAFLHVDCDLYSSTKTVLHHVGSRLRPGTVVLFDEYFNYQGWQDHEHKAWTEFVEATGLEFSYEGYSVDHEQVIVRVIRVPDVF
jgi:hypothetical protein